MNTLPDTAAGHPWSMPANIEMTSVPAAFDALCAEGRREYYQCPTAPVKPAALPWSHFKGVAGFGGELIFTHTDIEPPGTAPAGKYLVGPADPAGGQGVISHVGDTDLAGWPHPCGAQACGSFLAMGIQQSAGGPGADISAIRIYDIAAIPAGGPMKLVTTIARPCGGVNGVGMTKESGADGKYVVAAVNGNTLTIYRSVAASLAPGQSFGFLPVLCQRDFPDSGAGLALVTQTDGSLYMISMNANDDGSDSQIALYRLDLDAAVPACTPVAAKPMPVPGTSEAITLLLAWLDKLIGPVLTALLAPWAAIVNSSFRWGKGLVITSPDTMTIYATDRNVLPLSQLPGSGAATDFFSVVVWDRRTGA